MNKLSVAIDRKDVKIAIAVGICLLTSKLFPVIQYMAACFAAILCMQDNAKMSWKMGLYRLIITAIGGAVGILVVLADNMLQNQWLLIPMVMAGVLLTLWGCKLAKVPYITAMIGCITFLIVVMIMPGTQRIAYAGLRLLGTAYGVIVSLAVNVSVEFILVSEKSPISQLINRRDKIEPA